ncbi:MAG: ATP-binding protein [Deltaproteobacteria bacterium]|nr:ATP-binding protein [Deltaproteobacteria bacterium]
MSVNETEVIESLIAYPMGEHETLDYKIEFKLSNNQEKAEFIKDLAGFANHKGGYLIFGIDDKTHKQKGIEESEKEYFDQTKIGNLIKNYLSPIPDFKTYLFPWEGKIFGVIEISAFSQTPHIVTTALGGSIYPGDIFIRSKLGETKKIVSESEMRGVIERCIGLRKNEIAWMISTLLPKEPESKPNIGKILINRVQERTAKEWSDPNRRPLSNGRLLLAVPSHPITIGKNEIENIVRRTTVEYYGHVIPWPKTQRPHPNKGFVDYIWPEKNGQWVQDFSGIYSFADENSRLGFYKSYWEDLPPPKTERRFGFFTTLQGILMFLKFASDFMKAAGAKDFELHFFANDTNGRILLMDDRKALRTPFSRSHQCSVENIEEKILMAKNDSILDATVKLAAAIFDYFKISEELNKRLKDLLMEYCSGVILRLGIPK